MPSTQWAQSTFIISNSFSIHHNGLIHHNRYIIKLTNLHAQQLSIKLSIKMLEIINKLGLDTTHLDLS